jgi:hypothetical protein
LSDGSDAAVVIRSGVFRVNWLWHRRYSLVRGTRTVPQEDPLHIDMARYRFRAFPLDDREWREAITTGAF